MEQPRPLDAVIVDDDPLGAIQLQQLLNKNAKDISLKAVFNSSSEALAKIPTLKPQLLFLDIEMPGMNGFELLKNLTEKNFETIFITAHDHYAIRAIRFAALDYLLKPVDPTALQEAIERATEKIRKQPGTAYEQLLHTIPTAEKPLDKLAIPTMEGLVFVDLDDIIYCESSDKYTKIFLFNKKQLLASRTLGSFEELLQGNGFFRIHKSYLINLKHLEKYIKGEGGQVIMAGNITLDVSRRKKEELLQAVSRF